MCKRDRVVGSGRQPAPYLERSTTTPRFDSAVSVSRGPHAHRPHEVGYWTPKYLEDTATACELLRGTAVGGFVAFDCEWGRDDKVCGGVWEALAMYSGGRHALVVRVTAVGEGFFRTLHAVLEAPHIVKVFHEATNDLRTMVRRRLRTLGMKTPACRSLACTRELSQMLRIREQVSLVELLATLFEAQHVSADGTAGGAPCICAGCLFAAAQRLAETSSPAGAWTGALMTANVAAGRGRCVSLQAPHRAAAATYAPCARPPTDISAHLAMLRLMQLLRHLGERNLPYFYTAGCLRCLLTRHGVAVVLELSVALQKALVMLCAAPVPALVSTYAATVPFRALLD